MKNSVKTSHNFENIKADLKIIGDVQEIFETFELLKITIAHVDIEVFLSSTSEYIEITRPYFESVDENDKISLSVFDDIDENKADKVISFAEIDELTAYSYQYDQSDTTGYIEISITKSAMSLPYTTIYSLDALANYLDGTKNIEYIFKFFKKIGNKFKILDGKSHFFYTSNFVFSDPANFESRTDRITKKINFVERNKKRELINENCHFANTSAIGYLPEDFYFEEKPNSLLLEKLFDKLSLALILSIFSDVSRFTENTLSYKMYGYKTIKKDYSFTALRAEYIDDYFQSYKEVFNSSSNAHDKIGLSRNVISLHVINDDFTNIEGNICNSIRSNYNIYLKENVKKYIDVKNKITDTLFDLSSKFDHAADDLSASLKSSFYTLATLFISIMLLKFLKASNQNVNIFSFEIYVFLIIILIGMYIFKLYTIFETREKTKRLTQLYKQLKEQYKDILDEKDLDQIFTQSNFNTINVEYTNKKITKYNTYWNTTLLLYFLILTVATIFFNS